MENEDEIVFTKEDVSKHTTIQENATETEGSLSIKSKPSTLKSASEKEENSMVWQMNSLPEETAEGEDEILKEITASMFSSRKEINDVEKRNQLIRENKEGLIAKMISVDQLDKNDKDEQFKKEALLDGARREIKSSEKVPDTPMTTKRRRQRPFREIIGKREQRKEELEKIEDDLRQRLGVLECSIPAVMIWNIWRMAHGAPACKIRQILEKQFKNAGEISCRSTPSHHYDYRVREIEAERKQALKKVEEARALWLEKVATLEERRGKLEEAKRIQEEQRNTMERLNEEAKTLREEMEKLESEESCGECGDTQCKQRWLSKVSSVTSIQSGDIQYLEQLQQLAEEEIAIKRDIDELERREEAYMRALQQADELWSKMEGDDTFSTTSALQEQLDIKTAANQQLADRVCELEDALEQCRTRMALCRTELEKFMSIEKIEAEIGRDDDVAKVADKEITVRAKVTHRPIGRMDDIAMVKDSEVLAGIEVMDEETLIKTTLFDVETEATFVGKDVSVLAKPDLADIAVDGETVEVADAESVVRPEDIVYEEQRFKEIREYLAKLGSAEELYKDGEVCPPDFVCNDVVFSPTGMADEELIALGIEPTELRKELDRKSRKEVDDIIDDVEAETKIVEIAEEQIIEVPDVPVRKVVTRETIQEKDEEIVVSVKPTDESFITMPDDVSAVEIKEIEVDQIKPKEVMEKADLREIIPEDERKLVIEENEIKAKVETKIEDMFDKDKIKFVSEEPTELLKADDAVKIEVEPMTFPKITDDDEEIKVGIKSVEELKIDRQEVTIETKLEDKLTVLEKKEVKPETKNGSIPYREESPVVVRAPIEKVTESELLPDFTKAEIPTDIEPSKKDVKKDFVKEDVTEEAEEAEIKEAEAEKLPAEMVISDEIADKEMPLIVPKVGKEEGEILLQETIIEREKVSEDDIAPDAIEKLGEGLQFDEIKTIDVETKEIESIEETIAILDKVDVEKVDIEQPPIITGMGEQIEIKEIPLISEIKEERIEVTEPVSVAEIIKEKVEIEEPAPIMDLMEEKIEVLELAPIADIIKKEVEVREPTLIADVIIKEKAEIIEPVEELPSIKREIEELEMVEESLLDVGIMREKEEKAEEIPAKVTLLREPYEEREKKEKEEKEEEEEISVTEKEEMLMVVTPSMKPAEEKEKKKVPSIERKIQIIEAEKRILIAEMKPIETADIPAIPIDHRLVMKPYFVVTEMEEQKLLHIHIPVTKSVHTCTPETFYLQPPGETAKPTEIAQTDIVQTEIVQITTAHTVSTARPRTPPLRITSEYLKPSELKASIEIAGDRPEITGRKMLWHKRLKDQSTVATANVGSQTDKTSHVSHDRVIRDERDRARVPVDEILHAMKIAGPTRWDTEREIRTINYRKRSDEIKKMVCNCCLCGKTTSSLSIRSTAQPVDVKTATPPLTGFKHIFIPPKIDREVLYNKLCADCKMKMRDKMLREKYRIEKMKKPLNVQESCDCALQTGKPCPALPRKRTVEKKDQSCLAKIPKRKIDTTDQKRQPILEHSKKSDVEPLSPSCICFKLENTYTGSMKKGNCNCAQ